MAFEPARVSAETTAQDESRPIDHRHLARYTLGDRALERDVLRLFRSQAELYLERLRQADSPAQWAEAAHSLKGSARAIGASRVAAAATQAELIVAPADTRKTCLAEIEAAIAEADRYIRSLP
jgi:HPt (histidine-containing phosphotransfer) domain-containing protein